MEFEFSVLSVVCYLGLLLGVSSSWWWAWWCPKHVEQTIRSAIETSVASSWHFISTYHQQFLNLRWQFKCKTDGTEMPATDTRNLSLCCTNSVQLHDKFLFHKRFVTLKMCLCLIESHAIKWCGECRNSLTHS